MESSLPHSFSQRPRRKMSDVRLSSRPKISAPLPKKRIISRTFRSDVVVRTKIIASSQSIPVAPSAFVRSPQSEENLGGTSHIYSQLSRSETKIFPVTKNIFHNFSNEKHILHEKATLNRPRVMDILQESSGKYFQRRFVVTPIRYVLGKFFVHRWYRQWLIAGVIVIGCVWMTSSLFMAGMRVKGEVLGVSTQGYTHLETAVEDVKSQHFGASEKSFREAFELFSTAESRFGEWNNTLYEVARFIPGVSKISSGKYLVDAAKDIAEAGGVLSRAGEAILPNKEGIISGKDKSFLDMYVQMRGDVERAEMLLSRANTSLAKVAILDLPVDKRDSFLDLKSKLPLALSGFRAFLSHGDIFADIVGGNGPRKFLFLLQNNNEMRATGGFIGSYALLDMKDGRVRNFFVDGIFNPDGQFREDIIPPVPIQKISAGWSLHDSNWFPDFPTSAEKAILFYEKTGGPTVDGVIAFTPEILKRLLVVTGPIELPKYNMVIDAENFLEKIQYQVEVAYDKEENKPKQVLSDLAPILMERLFGAQSSSRLISTVLPIIESSFSEKQILVYSRNEHLEYLISEAGWSGKVLDARHDYLSVINTNINGFKTDGVIDEYISHRVDIQNDGSVINTVAITRTHRGGKTGYEWWDAVSANYMRVYVPLGSKLLSAEGQTREVVSPPVDYDVLGFSRDPDLERENRSVRIDSDSGTVISEDAEKTVFGNWVYVSPGESATVVYKYILPFRVDTSENGFASYSSVFQKQSGSVGATLVSEVHFPENVQSIWQSGENLVPSENTIRFETNLRFDRFFGTVFTSKDS